MAKFDCLKAVQNRKLERFNSPNIVTPSTQQHHRGEVNLPKSKNACTSSPLLLPYNFDLFINRVQPIGILASPFHNQRHRSLTTKQRLIYAVIKEPPSTLVFLHCIYVYTRCTAKCISWLIQPSLDPFSPWQYLFTSLSNFLQQNSVRSVLPTFLLLCCCTRIRLFSFSLSPSFSRRLLSKQEKRRDLSRLYEPTPVVRSETPAPSNRGQRWNTLEHTYEYDCSSRLYRLGDRKFLISWLYTGHRAFLETMRWRECPLCLLLLLLLCCSTVIPDSVFRPGYRKAWIWIFSRDWGFSQAFGIRARGVWRDKYTNFLEMRISY